MRWCIGGDNPICSGLHRLVKYDRFARSILLFAILQGVYHVPQKQVFTHEERLVIVVPFATTHVGVRHSASAADKFRYY